MVTLRIEHEITDLDTWLAAFGQFAEVRANAGVLAQRIYQPAGDDSFITLDLDFDSVDAADAFEQFLRSNVWSSPDASPALAGEVKTQLLTLCRAT
jgi:hypothetical protein